MPVNPAKAYDLAQDHQRAAADPRFSQLASANAGSGKTRVLVSRVSRLLLAKVPPEKILCLTYTKAAASEMQTRLFDTLGKWSVMDASKLNEELNDLLGTSRSRDRAELANARGLFAKALETPEGLKVQTIHAFCDRVLSRFPIEAGLLPGFTAMDDGDVLALRGHVAETLYRNAWANPDTDLARAIQHLASQKADSVLDGLMGWMASHAKDIRRWAEEGVSPLAETLGISENASPDDIRRRAWADISRPQLELLAGGLQGSPNVTDRRSAEAIITAINTADDEAAYNIYARLFLTQSGSLRSSPVTAKAPEMAQAYFGTKALGVSDAGRDVLETFEKIKSAQCLENSGAVLEIAKAYQAEYAREKTLRRWVDFNDQIDLVRGLLSQSADSEWVRYKLDGGIEHILVDEAQDTAPDQWDIIDSLRESFDDGTSDIHKTFFAVGDEKQSIYSFQGARPEIFLEQIRAHSGRENQDALTLAMSFRSTQEVLNIVDDVLIEGGGLQAMFDLDPLADGPVQIRHTARRGDSGQVDLWPLTMPPEDAPEERAWDTTPVDSDQSSSREKLADCVAQQIDKWLTYKEPIYDRDIKDTRPMQAGDILILVRGRKGGFFDAIIRNLKARGVPVAGADRLVLADSVAVRDLLSLTRFVLLPDDDLSLAEVLKSPLIGWDDDQLLEIAHGRPGTLWQALGSANSEHARGAAKFLKRCRTWSKRWPPYEFYSRVLDHMREDGTSKLKSIYYRLGLEARDALEAFLERAITYQRRGAPSLHGFLAGFEDDEAEIKRDMDALGGEVRVMTVHGAKGLEAPVVILPETTQTPTSGKDTGLIGVDGGFAYLPSKEEVPDALNSYRDIIETRRTAEYLRLFYVAMTRAEARLVICGYYSGRQSDNNPGFQAGSWYEYALDAFARQDTRSLETPAGEGQQYGEGALPVGQNPKGEITLASGVPEWCGQKAPEIDTVSGSLTPSRLGDIAAPDGMPAPSPLREGPNRFLRGNVIHRLLEILPDMPEDRRANAARQYLARFKELTNEAQNQIYREVFTVLEHSDYAGFFAPGSRAEIGLAGYVETLPGAPYVNAQIDRMVVNDDHIHIVDYKSNRPPPTRPEDIPQSYLAQMGVYDAMARQAYPGRDVTCALLWTDGPRLMVLDPVQMQRALTELGGVPN